MKERQVKAMLIIKNCNLINMAGIYKEKKDLVVKDGKVLDICDDACQKYGQGNVIIDALRELCDSRYRRASLLPWRQRRGLPV